eukprot:3941853-Rhodomonas_salina.3
MEWCIATIAMGWMSSTTKRSAGMHAAKANPRTSLCISLANDSKVAIRSKRNPEQSETLVVGA